MRRIENIVIFHIVVWLEVKKWKDGKSKFVYIYSFILVKKRCLIKTKKWQATKKKSNYPNLLKNKNHVYKTKSFLVKKKKTKHHATAPENQKK